MDNAQDIEMLIPDPGEQTDMHMTTTPQQHWNIHQHQQEQYSFSQSAQAQQRQRLFNADEADFIIDAFQPESNGLSPQAQGVSLSNLSARSLLEEQATNVQQGGGTNQYTPGSPMPLLGQPTQVKEEATTTTMREERGRSSLPQSKRSFRKTLFAFLGGSGSSQGSNGKKSVGSEDFVGEYTTGQFESSSPPLLFSNEADVPAFTLKRCDTEESPFAVTSPDDVMSDLDPPSQQRISLSAHRPMSTSSAPELMPSSTSSPERRSSLLGLKSHFRTSSEGVDARKRKSSDFLKSLSGRGILRYNSGGFSNPLSKKRRSDPVKLDGSSTSPAPPNMLHASASFPPLSGYHQQHQQQGFGQPMYPLQFGIRADLGVQTNQTLHQEFPQHQQQQQQVTGSSSFRVSNLVPFFKMKKKPWEQDEEKLILHVVYYFVEKDLRTISRIAQRCNVDRSVRAIDKKLKRLLNFEKWNMRVQADIQEAIRRMCKGGDLALSPEQRAKLEAARKEFKGANYPSLEALYCPQEQMLQQL